MKRVIAFIILLVHINTSMFIPVADEVDVFDQQGMQIGDINTLTEYVSQIVLGHKHNSKHDNDDDQAHYFNMMAKVKNCIFSQFNIVYGRRVPEYASKPEYPFLHDTNLISIVYDVPALPPRRVA